jgi:hypothetical protein
MPLELEIDAAEQANRVGVVDDEDGMAAGDDGAASLAAYLDWGRARLPSESGKGADA